MQRATLPTSHQLVISKSFACQWFFTKKIESIAQYTLQAKSLCTCEAKRNAHLPVSLRANDVCPTGKKQALRSSNFPSPKCLAALKIKTRVCFADLKGRPCFLFLCCHFLIKRRGVKNFLEPSKIRFKRGFFFFFFTINQLQSIKKHRRSHYVFSKWETCKCAFLKEWF